MTKEPTAKRKKRATAKKQKSTAKPEVVFAVDSFDEGDDDFAVDDFAVVDSSEWRIEKRTYTKKDGTVMLYHNYRKRKGEKDPATGKRINLYRKGGKKELK